MNRLEKIYNLLLSSYGKQGWWPIVSRALEPGFDDMGYHRGNYDYPSSYAERFEVAVGAILTQNTAWKNVERAISNLLKDELLSPERLLELNEKELANLILPSGYYNQKAKKLKNLARFFLGNLAVKDGVPPLREELLGIWGIGYETADSILLYGFNMPLFPVDAYTKRLFLRLGIGEKVDSENSLSQDYERVRLYVEDNLRADYRVYNEFHALIVEHSKVHCRARPLCEGCPLLDMCGYRHQDGS